MVIINDYTAIIRNHELLIFLIGANFLQQGLHGGKAAAGIGHKFHAAGAELPNRLLVGYGNFSLIIEQAFIKITNN